MQDKAQIYLSLVIPAYNESENITATLEDIADYLKEKKDTCEVIVVDDGSRDDTASLAVEAGRPFANFRLIENKKNCGKGYAVKRGIAMAAGSLILFMDADNSTRISQLEKLIPAIENGYDIAIASRRLPESQINIPQPLKRRLLGCLYIILSRLILGIKVKDCNCGFKLFKANAAKELFQRLTRDDWSFDCEFLYLASKMGLRVKEIPVVWEDRKKTSNVKPLRDGIRSLYALLMIKLKRYRPSAALNPPQPSSGPAR